MESNGRTESEGTRGISSTSRSLLDRARADDSEAWSQLVDLYAPLVGFWCRRSHLPEQDVSDVVQDVFQAVAGSLDRFRNEADRGTFRGWLRVITRNKITDHFRRRQNEPSAAGGTEAHARILQVAEGDLDDEADPPSQELALFHRALELIREDFQPNTWQAFWSVVVDGKTPSDVAEELAMRPGTVRVAKSRVLNRLRQRLGDIWT
jgi:RNA polymerase sigma-70 factor (ECF subfamily)